MKHTQEEIIDALQVIKDTCVEVGEKLEGCDSCPFYVDRTCVIVNKTPDEWKFNTGGPVWRAFE